MIDIVIPIFNAYVEVNDCIRSVLQNTGDETNILLIDDASTDFRIQLLLDDLSTQGDHRLKFMRNDTNIGFVHTVNRGMAHSNNDVVLLNSDTLVPPGWLQNLTDCARSRPWVATVTPFSNNGEICSYPSFCHNTAVGRLDLSALHEAMLTVDDGSFPQIPTAVGFCMYIRRAAINAVGTFDVERFGRGYGEENDFCMRTARAGFCHLMCTTTYVVHQGGKSFGDDGKALKEGHLHTLVELYPEYVAQISEFIANDPIKPFRDRVSKRLEQMNLDTLGRPNLPGLLMVSHGLGGGVEKHINDLAILMESVARVEILRPLGSDAITLDDQLGNRCIFDAANWPALVDTLASRNYARVHIHHTLGFAQDIVNLPRSLSLPYDVTLHDFGVYCPQFALMTVDARNCGEPDAAGCQNCLNVRPTAWNLSIADWRAQMHDFLTHAQRVVSPSDFVANKVRSRFREISIEVLPHPPRHEWLTPPKRSVKVLILGGLSRAKGLASVLACAWHAKHNNLALSFSLIGYLERGAPLHPDLPLHITGEYSDEVLQELIENERADCIWFPSQNPESYSYTLDVALASGLPIYAKRHHGAVLERLCSGRDDETRHCLLDFNLATAAMNSAFLRCRTTATDIHHRNQTPSATVKRQLYRDWIHAAFSPAPTIGWPRVECLSTFKTSTGTLGKQFGASMSLSDLYEQALECGHSRSRIALRQRLKEFESENAFLLATFRQSDKTGHEYSQDASTTIEPLANPQDIDFRLGGNASLYKRQGWDYSSTGGTWTIGHIARLVLKIGGPNAAANFRIEIVAQGIIGPAHPVTQAEIVINGLSLGTHAFGYEQMLHLAFHPPANTLTDGVLEIVFRILDPVSPQSLGLSEDLRSLGLLLSRLHIGPAPH
jgi:GT2 family glycosyltransferase